MKYRFTIGAVYVGPVGPSIRGGGQWTATGDSDFLQTCSSDSLHFDVFGGAGNESEFCFVRPRNGLSTKKEGGRYGFSAFVVRWRETPFLTQPQKRAHSKSSKPFFQVDAFVR